MVLMVPGTGTGTLWQYYVLGNSTVRGMILAQLLVPGTGTAGTGMILVPI